MNNYDLRPQVTVPGHWPAWQGWAALGSELRARVASQPKPRFVVAVDCYPGVLDAEVLPALVEVLVPTLVLRAEKAFLSVTAVRDLLADDLGTDRVRGFMRTRDIAEFIDPVALTDLQAQVASAGEGVVLVFGVGATLVATADLVVYCDLARWEIQLRYRRGEIANWLDDNHRQDFLLMYKRAYFVDWRVADRHKRVLLDTADYFLDTNTAGQPRMATGAAVRFGLSHTVRRPFRVVPYFDAGPWGGQWMKQHFGLDPSQPNYAWGFDCVPEENSLLLTFGGVTLELPSQNLVSWAPADLLGDSVLGRFGEEFPIRFDLLDTMGGGNLSLQVHPTLEFIREKYGMPYTQDESYYLLDAGPDASVYLGVKSGVDPQDFVVALTAANNGGQSLEAERFVARFEAHRHDHFLIPAGTVHCSGKDSVVLEISATPYIFTFKLWDWGRLGLDGRPRPLHLHEGAQVLNYQHDEGFAQRELANRFEPLGKGDGWTEERTGLHASEFIETRRHWFTAAVAHHTEGNLNVLNLVEGDEVVVESPRGDFEPFVVHYAETFIVPAAVGTYVIRPGATAQAKQFATLKAFVR